MSINHLKSVNISDISFWLSDRDGMGTGGSQQVIEMTDTAKSCWHLGSPEQRQNKNRIRIRNDAYEENMSGHYREYVFSVSKKKTESGNWTDNVSGYVPSYQEMAFVQLREIDLLQHDCITLADADDHILAANLDMLRHQVVKIGNGRYACNVDDVLG